MLAESIDSITSNLFSNKVIIHNIKTNETVFANLKSLSRQGLKICLFNNFKTIADEVIIEIPHRKRTLTITGKAFVIEKTEVDYRTTIKLKFTSMTLLNKKKMNDLMDALYSV